MKYSKHQQDYINSVGGALAHPSALSIISKQDMTIALLLGALKMARLAIDRGAYLNDRVTQNGPTISSVIDSSIADAEKGGIRVVDSSQFVEVLQDIAGYTGEGPPTTPWQDIVREISQKARNVLGIKETDGMLVPNAEYQTIVYY